MQLKNNEYLHGDLFLKTNVYLANYLTTLRRRTRAWQRTTLSVRIPLMTKEHLWMFGSPTLTASHHLLER